MKKINVCIIDDSEIDVFITKKVLSSIEMVNDISVYNNPEKALNDVIQAQERGEQLADVFLLDIMMPAMDGFDWIDELDEVIDEDFSPLIFILSATDMKKDFESFEKQRLSSAMLTKPLQKSEFVSLVTEHFEKEQVRVETKTPKHL